MAINRVTKQRIMWAAVGVLAAVFLPASINPAAKLQQLLAKKGA